jgi:hypothetical protein
VSHPPQWSAFTTRSVGGLLDVLKNRCGISQAFNPAAGGTAPPVVQFDAIWDTGATNSCVTQAVIDACGLVPIGMAQVHGVGGATTEEAFLVNIYLPAGVAFGGVRVTRGKFIGADILIGMDIISQGDFTVTNYGGTTKFSFRIPSQKHIDFFEQHQALMQQFGKGKAKHKKKKR